MKYAVLGAGLQGSACAFDLLQNPDVTEVRLADKSLDHLPGDGIAFGVNPRGIERLGPFADFEEPRSLREGGLPDSGNFEQLLPAAKRTVLRPPLDDPPGGKLI